MDMRTACVGCRQKRASSASACMSTTDAECAALLPLAPTRSIQASGLAYAIRELLRILSLRACNNLRQEQCATAHHLCKGVGSSALLPGDVRRQAASSANDCAADAVQVAAEAMQQAQLHMHC